MDNLEKVMQVFEKANQPLNSKAVQEATGLDKKEVDKLIKKLKDAGKLESPKRCFYQPKA
ncbi:MAG: MarR family transcriptional regulator [Syntrophomonadaceae bacterium]|nr:MarR family transcriptional regulator [Syntrophomonadaceae bacterium]